MVQMNRIFTVFINKLKHYLPIQGLDELANGVNDGSGSDANDVWSSVLKFIETDSPDEVEDTVYTRVNSISGLLFESE